MGFEFEVESLIFDEVLSDYKWKSYYNGEDKKEAFKTLEDLKKLEHDCVRLIWS